MCQTLYRALYYMTSDIAYVFCIVDIVLAFYVIAKLLSVNKEKDVASDE